MFQRHWIHAATAFAWIVAAPALAQSDGGNPELLADLGPVTAEMLANPSAGDWLIWRKTYDSHGFSPLDQIDTENVDRLAEAWRIPLGQGSSMATPLVHDGVMFLADTNDAVLALDARSGEELWRYEHETGADATAGLNGKFGIAIYGTNLIVPTLDLRLLALDFRTGEPVWEHAIAVTADRPQPLLAARRTIACRRRDRSGRYCDDGPRGRIHHRHRRRQRRRTVAVSNGGRAGRSRRAHLERHRPFGAPGRLGLGHRQLRSGTRSGLFRPGAHLPHRAVARSGGHARRQQRRAVHQFDDCPAAAELASWHGTSSTWRTINGTWTGLSSGKSSKSTWTARPAKR